MKLYHNSLSRALDHLYPKVVYRETLLPNVPRNYWADARNHRLYLEHFATKSGFDPLVAENWYLVKTGHLLHSKAARMLVHYKSFPEALVKCFPELNLDEQRFLKSGGGGNSKLTA